MVGLFAALLLLSISTRIAYNRVAGVIPPLLLVLSGTMACGAVCGTEHMALALCIVGAFVAFEKSHPRFFALALTAMVALRAEAVLLLACWALFWAIDRIRHRGGKQIQRKHSPWVFLPATVVVLWFSIYTPAGEPYPLYIGVFHAGIQFAQWDQGWKHFLDFVIVAVSPALLVLSLGFLLVGKLSGAGTRALTLSAVWVLWTVCVGGDALPFGLAYLPVFPLMCLAIQEAIVSALDTYRPSMEAASWVTLFVTAFAAASASKFPGNIGPLSLEQPHSRWLKIHSTPPLGHNPVLGRTQLHSEIRNSLQMKLVAESLEKHTQPGTRVLTPWPGHLAYRTGLIVEDWFGRLQSIGDQDIRPTQSTGLNGPMEAALGRLPDIVLPGIVLGMPVLPETVPDGLSPRLLAMASTEAEGHRVIERLRSQYQLLALPIRHPGLEHTVPYFVYQRKLSSSPPQLRWQRVGEELHLEVDLEARDAYRLPQMFDLIVYGENGDGDRVVINPGGQPMDPGKGSSTLVGNILPGAGVPVVRLLTLDLAHATWAKGIRGLSAQLYHPGMQRKHPMASIGAGTQIELTR